MRWRSAAALMAGALVLLGAGPRIAGDALIGTVTAVRRADLVVFNYGRGEYNVRLIGVATPTAGTALADSARQFVSRMALGKRMQMRFEYRDGNGDMLSRLFTTDTAAGIREVNVELLRAGLARRQPNYDYKYGELSRAETEARTARRGLWAAAPR